MSGENVYVEELKRRQRENPFVRLSDAIYDVLLDAILSSHFQQGEKLNISDIADAMQASRTPVISAVEKLTKDGLICKHREVGGYRSYEVFKIDKESLASLFVARKAIEVTAAGICASRRAVIDLKSMKSLALDFKVTWDTISKSGQHNQTNLEKSQLDYRFHELIILSTENEYLIEMFKSIEKKLKFFSLRTCDFVSDEKNKTNFSILSSQHESIFLAIETGIPSLAERAMGDHIDFCHSRCLSIRKI
uniref:GntR family transcriptional regulator n=1 Tax=Ndongobacter massiliensis TaxID=1871025 RepID=UPI000930F906|nr:GntR family transcriptional regulator [Ndongobacter massiliensis]